MGRIQDEAGRLLAPVGAAGGAIWRGAKDIWFHLIEQIRLTVDRDQWATASDWRSRLAAISWPRASVAAGLAAVAVFALWVGLQPTGIRSHPPRLPTEAEWRATQAAAEAMESELSPALAAANRSEGAGERP